MCSFTKISSLRGLYVWFHFYFILLNLCVFKLKPGELLMHVRVFLTSQMSLPCYHDALGLLWDISVVYHSPPLHQKLLSQTASCNKEAKNQFLCREKHSLVWVWGLFLFFFLDGLKDNGNLSGHNLFEKLKVLSLPCFFFLFKFLLIKMCSTQDGFCSLEFDVFWKYGQHEVVQK